MANPEVSDFNIFARKEHKSLFFPWKGKVRQGKGGGGRGGRGGVEMFLRSAFCIAVTNLRNKRLNLSRS